MAAAAQPLVPRSGNVSLRTGFCPPFGTLSTQRLDLVYPNTPVSLFVSGETASGKTTLLNAITTFIRPDKKIVSIEDTPELQVPHKNWIRETTRGSSKDNTGAEVGMFDRSEHEISLASRAGKAGYPGRL